MLNLILIALLSKRNTGDVERAIGDYTKAIELDPDRANASYNRVTNYGQKGETGCAIKDFNKATELKPDFVEAYYKRSVAYAQEG